MTLDHSQDPSPNQASRSFTGLPATQAEPPKRRLLDQVRDKLRLLHYSKRTEEAYVDWIRRFILHHGTRHPAEMGAQEVEGFLTYLAVELNVAASTQNQALSALLFLYRHVLEIELPLIDAIRAKHRPGIARTCRCQHHADLHACAPARGVRRAQSARSVVTGAGG